MTMRRIEDHMNLWKEDEIDLIVSFASDPEGDAVRDVSLFLGRTENAVKNKLSKLRKKENFVEYINLPWNEKEIEFLKRRYPVDTAKMIGGTLGRTVASVRLKAKKLGIKKNKSIKKFDEQIRVLANQGLERKEIAKELCLPYDSICKYLWEHKIDCKKTSAEEYTKHFRELEKIRFAYMRGEIK